jgi:hypothetical protein
MNGIAPIIQLLGNPDPKAPPVDSKIKQTVFITVAKIAKIGKRALNIVSTDIPICREISWEY